jgi:hypothetical protein
MQEVRGSTPLFSTIKVINVDLVAFFNGALCRIG